MSSEEIPNLPDKVQGETQDVYLARIAQKAKDAVDALIGVLGQLGEDTRAVSHRKASIDASTNYEELNKIYRQTKIDFFRAISSISRF